MEREDVQRLLAMIDAAYPNFKIEDMTATINAWTYLLKDYDKQDVAIAFKTFVTTKGRGFPPSVDELINMIHKPAELATMPEMEAWQIVRKAINRGIYHAQEDFDSFPEPIKVAVGSASQLRIWASDSGFNEGVESSNFSKRYQKALARENELARMPQEARLKIQSLQQLALEAKHGDVNSGNRKEI